MKLGRPNGDEDGIEKLTGVLSELGKRSVSRSSSSVPASLASLLPVKYIHCKAEYIAVSADIIHCEQIYSKDSGSFRKVFIS